MGPGQRKKPIISQLTAGRKTQLLTGCGPALLHLVALGNGSDCKPQTRPTGLELGAGRGQNQPHLPTQPEPPAAVL